MQFKTWERCLELSGTAEDGPDEYVAAAIQIHNCAEWSCEESEEWGDAHLTEVKTPQGYQRLCRKHLEEYLG
jgi:hypothetical protein